MRRIISLLLIISVIVCCGAVPVNAETTPATAERTATIHIRAAQIDDFFDNGSATDNNDGTLTSGGSKFTKVVFNTETNTHSQMLGLYNVSAPKAKATSGRFVETYIYDAATAPEGITPWEGFKVRADSVEVIANIKESYGEIGIYNPGIAISTTAGFANKNVRADSIRFKLPDQGTNKDAGVLLFGGSNKTYFSIQELNRPTLRILNGGAFSVDMSSGEDGYRQFIPEGTIASNKWYRAERILDTRIDCGTTGEGTENWQRFIIYEDATNKVIGDSGWVLTGNITKNAVVTDSYKVYPFASVSFAPINYPEGSYAYFDDIKSWALDTPEYTVGDEIEKQKYLTYPIENDGILPGTESSYRASWGLGFSTHMYYYYSSYSATAEYPYGVNGDHSSEKSKFQQKVLGSKYLYLQEDIMLPETNTRELGFFDLSQNQNYNTCHDDLTVDSLVGKAEYDGLGGVIRIKNGVMKVVSDYDKTQLGYTKNVKAENSTEDFSLNIENGKWYNIQLKIDQTEYVPFTCKANSGKTVDLDAATTPTTAQVTVTDEDGNVYKTAKFTYKSPADYIQYSIYQAVVLADIRRPNVSTGAVTGAKVNIDNIKCVLSDGTIDDENATVFYNEDFQSRAEDAIYNTFITDQFNPQNESYINGPKAYATDLAQVIEDDERVEGIPTTMEITFSEDIESNLQVLAEAVRLYKGNTDVSDFIKSMEYDAASKMMTLSFTALEANSEYSLVIDKAAAEVEKNIFSVLPGDNGKELRITFKTDIKGKATLVYIPQFMSNGSLITENGIGKGMAVTAGTGSALQNNGKAPSSYVVVAATFDANGLMEQMMSQRGVVAPNSTIKIDFNGKTLTPNKATSLKAFVWNTWRLMDLMTPVYEYPQQ